MPWERAAVQGHATDTGRTHADMQGNTSLRTGPWMLPLLQTPVVLPHGSGPQPGVHRLRTHPRCAPRQHSRTHTEHLLTLQHARRAGARLHGCWAGKAAPVGSRQRRGASPRPRFPWYLGGCSQRRGGAGGSPGRLARESRVPRSPGRFPSPRSSLLPRPSRFGRKRLIFLHRAGASSPRPRSCEQCHSRLALHTRIAAVKSIHLLRLGVIARISLEFTAKYTHERFRELRIRSAVPQGQREHRSSLQHAQHPPKCFLPPRTFTHSLRLHRGFGGTR